MIERCAMEFRKAKVSSIIYEKEDLEADETFYIFSALVQGDDGKWKDVTIKGNSVLDLRTTKNIKFLGALDEYKGEPQWDASYIVGDAELTPDAAVTCLKTSKLPNVGKVSVSLVLEAHEEGGDIIDILSDVEKMTKLGIDRPRAEKLYGAFKSSTIPVEVLDLVGKTGLKQKTITDIFVNFPSHDIGELLSTRIVSAYLEKSGTENIWFDVRNYIKTDSNYRDAKVDWELTEELITKKVDTSKINITQGFIAANDTENTTTLGREGSDYTAGIFAYCLDAESVTIWKDVDGVLNADPRVFEETTLLKQISYEETIEMAFYGASVIHPKTIQPLQNKEIPLYVRSFIKNKKEGTKVSKGKRLLPYIPCFIVKKNQILVSISANDFSFMVENNISYIFKKLHNYKLKVNLIQNSAISFSVCVDNKFNNFDAFFTELKNDFKIDYQKGIDLYTIRHFNDTTLQEIQQKGEALLTQINKETAQIVIKPI